MLALLNGYAIEAAEHSQSEGQVSRESVASGIGGKFAAIDTVKAPVLKTLRRLSLAAWTSLRKIRYGQTPASGATFIDGAFHLSYDRLLV
jgi:hypothetical protein